MLDRLPPQAAAAEESLLSACLIDNNILADVFDILSADDFYRTSHQCIFKSMRTLYSSKEPVDLTTTFHQIKQDNNIEKVGGAAYLSKLVNEIPLAVNAVYYAKIIKEKATLRQLISAANDIMGDCFNDNKNTSELIDSAQKRIMGIDCQKKNNGSEQLNQVIDSAIDRLEKLNSQDSNISGVSSGYKIIDKMTSGFQNSDLIILAARPAMGKSAFAGNILDNVVMSGGSALVFSIEMQKVQWVNRLLSKHARINGNKFKSGDLIDDEWKKVTNAAGKLYDGKLFINDTLFKCSDILRESRRCKKEHDIKLIVIDYLQLVKGENVRREEEVSGISRTFKTMAKELDVPVIALAQLNRGLESRNNKRPILSDLRESGAIEQDADIVMFLYRDEMYHQESIDRGLAEISFAKNRHGDTGICKLVFKKELTAFFNLQR